jgi:arylsulfatase A-like enzyme
MSNSDGRSVCWIGFIVLAGATAWALTSCGGQSHSGPPAFRLVERFAEASVENTPTSIPTPPSPKWGDGGNEDLDNWKAGTGLSSLRSIQGRLVGTTNDEFAVMYAAKPVTMNEPDSIHAIEVRMRASAGTRVAADFSNTEELDFRALRRSLDSFQPSMSATLVPGDEFQTYILNRRPAPAESTQRIQHLLLLPTDEAGAEVEIESIRVIYRKEHLLATPTGVSWQGLSNVFRESLVSRSPERIVFDVDLPDQPWLDLGVGSLEGGPLTFRVSIESGSQQETVLQRTVTTPQQWTDTPVDLRRFAGRSVKLSLELDAPIDGTLGIWGAPAIRNRNQSPIQTASAATGAGEVPRGVILIVGDTLRWDHLDAYGYEKPTAPQLKELARQGVLFKDNQSQGVWTKISVPSILTSLYPTTHGLVGIPDRISAAAVTAAEVFQEAGYATWASSSVPFSGQLTNLHQGVEVLYERPSVQEPGAKTARPFIDYLLPWLETHRDVPFFVFLHVFDPHSPFEPRRPYNNLWVSSEERAAHDEAWARIQEHVKQDFFKRQQLANAEEIIQAAVSAEALLTAQKGWYDGSIKAMDDEIGRVLEFLDRTGLREDTLIAFVSDHGEEFLERGYPFHGFTVYGEMTNVPLLLNWPGRIPAGVEVEETTQSIDLLPTLLELSGLEIPEIYQGRSLAPFFLPGLDSSRLDELKARPAFSERRATNAAGEEEWQQREAFAVVFDGWKLVHNVERMEGIPEWELFDHREDPWDLVDLAPANPDVVERLRPLLEDYLERTMAARLAPEAATEGLSEEELRHLRALGYVQ